MINCKLNKLKRLRRWTEVHGVIKGRALHAKQAVLLVDASGNCFFRMTFCAKNATHKG